ncbi:unnamed protein product [Amoebophrya sp. A25]|nr:unnamed protein product [Amoebophrya sp. A25]|eukprot:GSA25T00026174001.1
MARRVSFFLVHHRLLNLFFQATVDVWRTVEASHQTRDCSHSTEQEREDQLYDPEDRNNFYSRNMNKYVSLQTSTQRNPLHGQKEALKDKFLKAVQDAAHDPLTLEPYDKTAELVLVNTVVAVRRIPGGAGRTRYTHTTAGTNRIRQPHQETDEDDGTSRGQPQEFRLVPRMVDGKMLKKHCDLRHWSAFDHDEGQLVDFRQYNTYDPPRARLQRLQESKCACQDFENSIVEVAEDRDRYFGALAEANEARRAAGEDANLEDRYSLTSVDYAGLGGNDDHVVWLYSSDEEEPAAPAPSIPLSASKQASTLGFEQGFYGFISGLAQALSSGLPEELFATAPTLGGSSSSASSGASAASSSSASAAPAQSTSMRIFSTMDRVTEKRKKALQEEIKHVIGQGIRDPTGHSREAMERTPTILMWPLKNSILPVFEKLIYAPRRRDEDEGQLGSGHHMRISSTSTRGRTGGLLSWVGRTALRGGQSPRSTRERGGVATRVDASSSGSSSWSSSSGCNHVSGYNHVLTPAKSAMSDSDDMPLTPATVEERLFHHYLQQMDEDDVERRSTSESRTSSRKRKRDARESSTSNDNHVVKIRIPDEFLCGKRWNAPKSEHILCLFPVIDPEGIVYTLNYEPPNDLFKSANDLWLDAENIAPSFDVTSNNSRVVQPYGVDNDPLRWRRDLMNENTAEALEEYKHESSGRLIRHTVLKQFVHTWLEAVLGGVVGEELLASAL